MDASERQNGRVRKGMLLIAALLAASFFIFFLEDLIGLLRRDYEVVAVVRDATGIVNGSTVWIGGKEVGTVRAVAFLPSGADTVARIALTLELPQRLQAQVREDSRVRITAARLIGDRSVDIVPGSEAAPVVAPGDTLRQRDRLSVNRLAARAASVRAGLDSVVTELSSLAPVARERLDETQRAFIVMQNASSELTRLNADLAASPGAALLADTAFRSALRRAQAHAGELPAVIGSLRDRSSAAAEVGAALARLQARADTLAGRLDAAAFALDAPNGSLTRFQQDTALAAALRSARTELDSLMAEVRRNPLRFVF